MLRDAALMLARVLPMHASLALPLVAAALSVVALSCDRGPAPPSVVLIVLDTLRADHVGAFGAGEGRTPILDKLAGEGIAFESCVSQYPLTFPSVVSMFTSQWPCVHRVRDNFDQKLVDDAHTLTELLDEAGYRTAAFVSALPVRAETGLAQGFDHFDDDFSDLFPFYNPKFAALGDRWTGSERRGDVTVSRAVEWLEKTKEPYFLFVHLFDPHAPYDPPEPHASVQPTPYAGEVAYTDELVGRLIDALSAQSDEEPPLVVVISDHGEGLGEHNEEAHGQSLYDTTIHVPWILWWPGHLTATRVNDRVTLLDLAPTIVDAVGIEPPDAWMGRSCLDSTGDGWEPLSGVYAENYFTRIEYGWSELKAWITPEWKYVRAPRPELYDRRRDPDETNDLATSHVEIVTRLDEELTAFERDAIGRAASHGIDGLVEQITPEERVKEWLAGLGYVGTTRGSGSDGPLPDPKDMIPEWNRDNEAKRHVARGERYLASEQYLLALVAFRTAAKVKPTPDGYRGHGLALLRTGHYADARDTLKTALESRPDDLAVMSGYAVALDATGDLTTADSVLERATRIDSTAAVVWHHRATLNERLGRLDVAVECFETYCRQTPSDMSSLESLADLYRRLDRHDRSVSVYRRLASAREWDPVAFWRLGTAEEAAGHPDAARDALRRGRELTNPGALRDSIDIAIQRLREHP